MDVLVNNAAYDKFPETIFTTDAESIDRHFAVNTRAGVLMMVLLGGMGTLWGPLVGAVIFIYIQDYISTMTEHWEIYLGIVVILLVLFMPTGFVGLGAYFKRLRKG